MAKERNLKLNLLTDTSKFNSGIKSAEASVNGFDATVSKFTTMAAAKFAALASSAGYAAIRIGKDAVNAALEDQRSTRILEVQLRKTVEANDAVIASVNSYISATSLRVGVQDDFLRPSLARLLRSTEDVTKAQDLLNLSLDISTATGKEVDAVASAIGKAYDGNAVSLAKLGLGIDSTILKSGDMNLIISALRENFGGFADIEAQTLDGRIRTLRISTDELKESIGYALLPALEDFVKYAQETLIPTINDIKGGYDRTQVATKNLATVTGATLKDNKTAWQNFFKIFSPDGAGKLFQVFVADSLIKIGKLTTLINTFASVAEKAKKVLGIKSNYVADDSARPSFLKQGTGVSNYIADYTDEISRAVSGTKELTQAQKDAEAAQKALEEQARKVADAFDRYSDSIANSISSALNFSTAFADRGNGSFLEALRRQAALAMGFGKKISALVAAGLSRGAISQLVAAGPVAGSQIADELLSGGVGAISETNALVGGIADFSNLVGQYSAGALSGGGLGQLAPNNYNITINGIVDSESARRTIEQLLQDSARRTGAVSLVGATL